MVPITIRRRFTLLDGMVMIAVMALACASAVPYVSSSFYLGILSNIGRQYSSNVLVSLILSSNGYVIPFILWPFHMFLLFQTLALAGLRFLPPRPRRRALGTQLGTVACLAASLVIAVDVALSILVQVSVKNPNPISLETLKDGVFQAFQFNPVRDMATHAGWAVAIAWLMVAARGPIRPSKDWIDHLGRLVGVCWILPLPLYNTIFLTQR